MHVRVVCARPDKEYMGYEIFDQRGAILKGVEAGVRDLTDVDRFGFVLTAWDGEDVSCCASISFPSREDAEAYYILYRLSR